MIRLLRNFAAHERIILRVCITAFCFWLISRCLGQAVSDSCMAVWQGWVKTTYVDETFRIGHGDKGSVFVTAKKK